MMTTTMILIMTAMMIMNVMIHDHDDYHCVTHVCLDKLITMVVVMIIIVTLNVYDDDYFCDIKCL